jgi:AcrR family transcriptional regulator
MAERIKRRNAETTRAAIFASARRLFARSGYATGVREIAQEAGVTAMLVNRYFGSKQQLFAEVLEHVMAQSFLLTPEAIASDDLAKKMATSLVAVTKHGDSPLDGFSIMMHSLGNKDAVRIARRNVEQGRQKQLASLLKGRNAQERAAVILALIAGFQVMRQTLGLTALSKADPDDMADILAGVLQGLMKSD